MKKFFFNFLIITCSYFPDFMLRNFEFFSKKSFSIFFLSRKKKKLKSKILFENISIVLNLKKNDDQAHDVYRALNKNKNLVYELPLISSIIEIINKTGFKNFLDVGAFMGYYSILLSKFFKKNFLNIYAIESNPSYCEIIKKNLSENKSLDIKIINAALSNNNDEDLFIDKESIKTKENNMNLIKIKSKTLDYICFHNFIKPEIVKIDVHGFEGKVLNGFTENLKENVKVIFLELHSQEYLQEYSGTTKKEIINFLINKKFNCYLLPYTEKLNLYHVSNDFNLLNYKNSYRKINEENYRDLFFDKENKDNLVIALDRSINIKNFNCFHHL